MVMNKKRLQLNNVGNVRRTVAKVCRDMYTADPDDPLDLPAYRALLDGLKLLLTAYRTESDLEIETRLDLLEKQLADRGMPGSAEVRRHLREVNDG
jgi:hypothetical protein